MTGGREDREICGVSRLSDAREIERERERVLSRGAIAVLYPFDQA